MRAEQRSRSCTATSPLPRAEYRETTAGRQLERDARRFFGATSERRGGDGPRPRRSTALQLPAPSRWRRRPTLGEHGTRRAHIGTPARYSVSRPPSRMKHSRSGRWLLLTVVIVTSACARISPRAPSPSSGARARAAIEATAPPAARGEAQTSALPTLAPGVVSIGLPPPPMVTRPLPGEAAATTLAEARLVASDCEALEAATRRLAEQRVREMRQALAEEYRQWAAEQPECWRTFRELGEGFGSGRFGLSGARAHARTLGLTARRASRRARRPHGGERGRHRHARVRDVARESRALRRQRSVREAAPFALTQGRPARSTSRPRTSAPGVVGRLAMALGTASIAP